MKIINLGALKCFRRDASIIYIDGMLDAGGFFTIFLPVLSINYNKTIPINSILQKLFIVSFSLINHLSYRHVNINIHVLISLMFNSKLIEKLLYANNLSVITF
jgi:hypothetical protein